MRNWAYLNKLLSDGCRTFKFNKYFDCIQSLFLIVKLNLNKKLRIAKNLINLKHDLSSIIISNSHHNQHVIKQVSAALLSLIFHEHLNMSASVRKLSRWVFVKTWQLTSNNWTSTHSIILSSFQRLIIFIDYWNRFKYEEGMNTNDINTYLQIVSSTENKKPQIITFEA